MWSVKRNFFFVLLFFCALGLLHKQIVGAVIRYALRAGSDVEMAYRSMEWREGELVFSDLVVFDPTFHAHVERAALRVDWRSLPKLRGHLVIDKPYVSVLRQRNVPERRGEWVDFSFDVNEGTLEWDGLAQFEIHHGEEGSHLTLDWADSGVAVKVKEGHVEADLRKFRVGLLKSLFPYGEIGSGTVSGKVHLTTERELITANLKVGQLALKTPVAGVEGVDGTLSYNAQLGAKWELQGFGLALGKTSFFKCEGRGFFRSQWVESEVLFDDASFKVGGSEIWTLECCNLRAEQLCLLKAGAVAIWPDLVSWNVLEGVVNGVGSYSSPKLWNLKFEGKDLFLSRGEFRGGCKSVSGSLNQEGGQLALAGEEGNLALSGTWTDWEGKVCYKGAECALKGGWEEGKFPVRLTQGAYGKFSFAGEGWIDASLDLFFKGGGDWTFANQKIPFSISQLSKEGNDWSFDFRFVRSMWDLFRLKGIFNGEELVFDPKCHFLGNPIAFSKDWTATWELPWKSLLSLKPMLAEWGFSLPEGIVLEKTEMQVGFKKGKIEALAKSASPPFALQVKEREEGWAVALDSALKVAAVVNGAGEIVGSAEWKGEGSGRFQGKITPQLGCEFYLPELAFHLKKEIEGNFEGKGFVRYEKGWDVRLELNPTHLKVQSHELTQEGPFLVFYSAQGVRFEKLNLHGPFDCAAELLEFDPLSARCLFHKAKMRIPASLLTQKFLQWIDRENDLCFVADLDFATDFSHMSVFMEEASIPLEGQIHQVRDLHLFWKKGECKAALRYQDQLHRISFHVDEKMEGRLILGEEETPLTIDWEYDDELKVHSVEGSFGGLEASFHAESPDTLIGSARVDFSAFAPWLPPLQEIKMGKGYELKGRLKIEKNVPSFKGILSGKQLELFGFQFRTLLAQADLGIDHVKLSDVKISDTAGMMKIDQLVLETVEEKPWTVFAPQITLLEFRPSLLQRPGEAVGPISPLVVRKLKLLDLKGLLEDGKTYTAKGELHFINSYKREETVFDLPANVLSRIVGLDLELLIPVCGDLSFKLEEGYFNLLELKNAFSEANRSEFFLEMDPPPRMDLDGNLKIFVKMKQFVLLKITESFLISIEGQIDDPQFSLKRKGYFGLM
jgi:hypothetical protein